MAATATPAASETTTPTPEAAQESPKGWLGEFKAAFEAVNAPAPEAGGAAEPEEPKAAQADTKAPKKEPAKEPAKKGALTAADLAARDRSIKDAQERRKIAQERDQLASELKEYKEWKRIKENAKEDPWAAVKWMGFDKPEELPAALASKGPMTAERQKLQELEQWRAAQEQEKAAAQQAQLIEQGRAKIAQFLGNDERFEITRANPSGVDTVLAVMNQHWEATKDPVTGQGEYMKPEEAAQIVENYFEAELDKLTQLSKVKKKLGAAEPSKPSPASAPRQSPRTISSKMSATTAPPSGEQSDEDRKRWFADELKKHFGA